MKMFLRFGDFLRNSEFEHQVIDVEYEDLSNEKNNQTTLKDSDAQRL